MHRFLAVVAGAWDSIAGVSLAALAVSLVLHVGKLCAEARAWHWIVLYAHEPRGIRFRTTLGAFVSAIGANAVLPARVGEALRVGVVAGTYQARASSRSWRRSCSRRRSRWRSAPW